MLIFRKILLLNKIYYFLFITVLIISIIRINLPKKSNYNNSKYAIGKVTYILYKDDKLIINIKNKENLIINYYTQKKINISLGDTIKVYGEFIKPENNTTKYLFNYKKYLKRKNIFYIINCKKLILIKKNKNIFYKIKQTIISHLKNNPYLYIFLLGDKSLINKDVLRSYQENGISHLFAISGMHISLIANIINKLLKKYFKEEKIFKITSIVLVLYLLLVGFSPSILRGVLFYILFSINKIYYFYIKPINLVLLISSISLLINPNYIFDVGFQYSYLISISLILFSIEISNNNYFISLFKTSLLSFFVSVPITLYNYYQLNLLSIIYNLFFVPLISIIIFPLSLLVFMIKPLIPIYNFLINILENISISLNNINITKIMFKRLPIIIYIFYLLLIIIYLIRKKKVVIFIFCFLLLIHYIISVYSNNIYLEMLDVKQGDSSLIKIKNKNIFIDTGGKISNTGEIFYNVISPSLKSKGIRKINFLIITHGDFDHMGEAINLVKNFKVEKVIFNCGEYNVLEKELIKVLDKKKIKYYSCIRELNIDNNKLYFLQTKEYDNENDNSNVIITELNGYKFMFMGDASITTEKEILDKYNLPDIDVLKVGHHGSKTSSGKSFINEMNPKYSIISVGKNNRYGHPNKEVLENLENSKIYRTDQDGSIIFKIKNNKLNIETCVP